ncbi:Uncharacterised protein [Burkholderia pseudomallei]|nr:Uncharacterised protein [Burkholderia pseudomallei]
MKSDWVPPGAVSSAMVWRLFWNDLRDARAGGEHCFGFAGGDGLGGKMGCGKNMDSIFIEFSFDFYVIDVRFLEGKWFGM